MALAYGRHVAGGNVILLDQTDPDVTIAFIALGEGQWDGIDSMIVNGAEWDVSIPENYQFHKGLPGQLSSEGGLQPEGAGSPYPFDTDGDQKADSLTPPGVQGLTFSRTAYIALRVPFDVYAPGPELSFQGVFRCRKVRIFDADGVLLSTEFSDNPAWCIVDLLTRVRGLNDSRIDYASFVAAADYCDALIDPDGEGDVKRFVSNVAFTQPVDLDQALDALLVTCRGSLLDYEGTVKLRIDQTRSPVFDFGPDNIIEGSFSARRQDTRATANRLELNFRDTANDYQLVKKIWNHESQQAAVGRVVTAQVELGNMPQQQAERIGNYLLTRAIDNNLYARLRSTQASLKVMPGDVVRVKHDAAPWGTAPSLYETFEVLEAADNADETRDFLLQVYRAATYSDAAGPAQNLVATTLARSGAGALPAPNTFTLSANLSGELRLAHFIPAGGAGVLQRGRLFILADFEADRVGPTTTLAANFAPEDTQMTVASTAGLRVDGLVNVGTGIIIITGPGDSGEEPTSTTLNITQDVYGSTAVGGTAGDAVYQLEYEVLPFEYPSDIQDGGIFEYRFKPGRRRILWAALSVSDGLRDSVADDVQELLNTYSGEPNVGGRLLGVRASIGLLQTIDIAGPLAVSDRMAEDILLPSTSISIMFATLQALPEGSQPVKFRIDSSADGGDTWAEGGEVEMPAQVGGGITGSGTFASGAQAGNAGGLIFRIVITQVGDIGPGNDFRLYIYY